MATGPSTAVADSISKHLTCSICLEAFKVPKALSCLHTFCESCLNMHICKTGVSGLRKYFECPLCRANIFPNERLTKEQWAKSFPTNHMVVSLLEDENLRPKTISNAQTEIEAICKPCYIDDKQARAFCFCVNCKEYLCKACYEDHRKFKSTRNHTVLKGEDLPKDTSAFDKLSELMYCDIHSDEKIEYKCTTDHVFLCSICATTSHIKCERIEYIGNVAKKDKTFTVDTSSLQRYIQRQIETNLRAVEKLGCFASDIGQHISDVKEQMKVLITQLEANLEHAFKARVENEKQKLTEALQKLLIANDKLTQADKVVKVTEKYGSEVPTALLEDWFEDVRKEAKRVAQAEKEISLSVLEAIVCNEAKVLKAVIQDQILNKLKEISATRNSTESQSVAQTSVSNRREMRSVESKYYELPSVNKSDDEAEAVDSDSESDEPIDLENESLMNCDIDQIGQYDISISTHASKPCCHNGSLFLPNGNMIFIDKENQLIKVVTEDFHIKCYKLLEDVPLDVCFLKNNKIAVATFSSVTILDVASKLEEPLLQSMTKTVHSLCPLKDEVWMLCTETVYPDTEEQFHIIIVDSKFRTIDRRDTFKSCYGTDTTLKHAKLIRSRKTNEFIICTPKEVKTFKLCGSERWYFKPSGLRHAEYLAFDVQNNLYVADIESGTIYQMSSDSYRNYRTLIRGIQRPASILFNPNEQTLVIGCSRKNDVYEYQFTSTRSQV